jgi:organic radical activating enzyme
MKFRYLKIDLESQTTYTCHAATPHKIDFEWLKNNSGNLFNHNINVLERKMMLNNQRAASCEQNCWHAEDQGMKSPRLYQKGYYRTHDQIVTSPETLDFTVGADCNLTCTYCCKEFSSAWRNDIQKNGEYQLSDSNDTRYKLTSEDRVLIKIKQSNLVNTSRYQLLIDEIKLNASSLKHIDVTGGEPFLNNYFINALSELDLPDDVPIEIYTGLGVNYNRFNQMLDKISNKKNIRLSVSAEGIEQYLEFNRYGVKWQQFLNNLQSIRDRNINFKFHSTVTNLTVFGFFDFCDYFKNDKIITTYAYQPRMMAVNIVDDDSKLMLANQFNNWSDPEKSVLIKNINAPSNEKQRIDLSTFLTEFVKRRPDLSLNIYPKSFLNWLGINSVV